jgi:hypothetical protein
MAKKCEDTNRSIYQRTFVVWASSSSADFQPEAKRGKKHV